MKKQTKQFLWIIPFIIFFSTYISLYIYFNAKTFPVPNFIGHSLYNAITQTTMYSLYPKILKEITNENWPEGTILQQIPQANTLAKKNQIIYFIISKKHSQTIPSFIGKKRKQIEQKNIKNNLNITMHYVPHIQPYNTCIAQINVEHKNSINNNSIVYLAKKNDPHFLMPNIKDMPYLKAAQALKSNNIHILTHHEEKTNKNHSCDNCLISNQNPQAGSIISLDTTQTITLHLKTIQPQA